MRKMFGEAITMSEGVCRAPCSVYNSCGQCPPCCEPVLPAQVNKARLTWQYCLWPGQPVSIIHGLQAQNTTGATPLHDAASRGHSQVVRVLLLAGARAEATDQVRRHSTTLGCRYGKPFLSCFESQSSLAA